MASEYRNTCDICGIETRGFNTDQYTDKELAKNNWDIRVDSHWFEQIEDSDLLAMEKATEINKDACFDCAIECSRVIKEWIKKKNEQKSQA